jgi:hypothetical protein
VLKLLSLRTGQGKLLMFETIPKLRDQRQTFGGRQTADFIRGEQFRASQPTGKRTGGQASKKTCSASVRRFAFQLQIWPQTSGADLISVSRQLFDHPEAENPLLRGVVQYVKPDQSRVQIPVSIAFQVVAELRRRSLRLNGSEKYFAVAHPSSPDTPIIAACQNGIIFALEPTE